MDIATKRYGILTGPAVIVPLILSSLLAGAASEAYSRKWIMCASIIGFSVTVIINGYAMNFATVLAMRIVLGFALGFFVPPAVSLICDYFPPNRQTTALAVFAFAESVSDGLTDLTTIMISV